MLHVGCVFLKYAAPKVTYDVTSMLYTLLPTIPYSTMNTVFKEDAASPSSPSVSLSIDERESVRVVKPFSPLFRKKKTVDPRNVALV